MHDVFTVKGFRLGVCFSWGIISTKISFELVTKCFHVDWEYRAAERWPFYLWDWGKFFWTFTLRTNAPPSDGGCVEQMSRQSPTATTQTTTSMADKLITYVTQCQVLFDTKRHKWNCNSLKKVSGTGCGTALTLVVSFSITYFVGGSAPKTSSSFLGNHDVRVSCQNLEV